MSTATIRDRDGERKVPAIHYAMNVELIGYDDFGNEEYESCCVGIEARSEDDLRKLCREHFGEGALQECGFETGPGGGYTCDEDLVDEDEVCYIMYQYITENEE